MLIQPPCHDARSAFQSALLHAITEGRMPDRTGDLNAHTWSAIEAIALDHPDATVRLIAGAYDTFEQEADAVA